MNNIPPITKNLIIINLICYFASVVAERWGIQLNHLLGLHFFLASDFHIFQFFTYMFMHGSMSHIFMNLFTFWMFGRIMERTWGPRRFLLFYLVCGMGAGVIQEIVQLGEYYAEGLNEIGTIAYGDMLLTLDSYLNLWTTVGASGAVYGILLGFGMTFPNERILLLIPPIPMKAKYLVVGCVVLEFLLGFNADSNVAHFAHLGGMLFGWLLIRHWRRVDYKATHGFTGWTEYRPKQESRFTRMKRKFSGVKTPHNSPWRKESREPQPHVPTEAERQAEIDKILEKIKRSGYDSLTSEEKARLFDAGNN